MAAVLRVSSAALKTAMHRCVRVQCPTCRTHVLPGQENRCSYCESPLDARAAAREKTPVGIPNFFSLRDEINARIAKQKAAFFSAIFLAILNSSIFLFALPSSLGLAPLTPLVAALWLIPITYLHSKLWRAVRCPRCKGTLAGVLKNSGKRARNRRSGRLQPLPSIVRAHVTQCPHCRSDLDHSPGTPAKTGRERAGKRR